MKKYYKILIKCIIILVIFKLFFTAALYILYPYSDMIQFFILRNLLKPEIDGLAYGSLQEVFFFKASFAISCSVLFALIPISFYLLAKTKYSTYRILKYYIMCLLICLMIGFAILFLQLNRVDISSIRQAHLMLLPICCILGNILFGILLIFKSKTANIFFNSDVAPPRR